MTQSKSIIQNGVTTVSDPSPEINATSNTQNNLPSMIRSQIAENFVVVWLNLYTNYSDEDVDRSINQLQYVAKSVRPFTDSNQCIDFITDIIDEEIFLIISGPRIQQLVSSIGDISQLYSIYIFDTQDAYHEADFQECRKVKGIFVEIRYIYDALKRDTSRLMVDLTPFSIVPITSSPNLDELDQSFMYTQLIKEIILEIEPDANAKEQYVRFYRKNSGKTEAQAESLEKFQQSYVADRAIWWYARESFLFEILNKALRTQDTKTIIKMGFFLRDLHHQIEQKHLLTKSHAKSTTKIIVYRGQGMSSADFEKLTKNEGGLISFNSFLSTSLARNVSLMYVDSVRQNPDITCVLFRIEVDPSISSSPFVNVNDIGYSASEEQEILFSMHTVFRIGDMHRIKDRLWEVNLTLTGDNNSQLKCLTDYIRNQIDAVDGWYRLAFLMLQMGKINDALEIFDTLYQTTCDDDDPDIGHIRQSCVIAINAQLYSSTEIHSNAFVQLKTTLDHWKDTLPLDDPMFGMGYMSMSHVYRSSGDYVTALTYSEKALEIFQQTQLSDESVLAIIHNNVGELHRLTGNYPLALSHFEKALDVLQKSCPSNHPNLALVYNSIALVHVQMDNNAMASSHFEKALVIHQSFPPDHPFLVVNYSNIGQFHQLMGDYPTALSYYQKAYKICQNSLPLNHPNHAVIYNNLAVLYRLMKDYKTSVSYSQKALEIQENCFKIGHPELALTYVNIAITYQSTGDYLTSLSYLKKALAIQQITLLPNHPDLVANLKLIGELYHLMGNHEKALSYYEQVLEIWQKSSSSDQSNLAEIYNKIGASYQSIGRCPMATQYFEKALEIQKKSLPFDHPDLIETYNNIAAANQLKGDILTTVSYWEKMCHIQQRDLSNNRLSHSSSSDNFEAKHQEMVYTSKAISQMKQVFESQQRLFSSDHGVADWTGNDIDEVKHMSEVCSGLIENLEAACQVQQASSTSGNPFIPNTYSNDGAENQTTDNYLNAILSAVKDVQKLLPANHNESTSTENDASVTQSTTNNMLIAQQSFQQIMESCQKLHLPNDPSAAVYYDHIGNGLCSMGDYWSALTFFEKALEIILTSLSNNHPLLAKTYSNMAKALDGCGRYKEAVDCAEQAVTTARQNFESTSVEIEAYENQLLQLQQKMGLCIKS